MRRMIVVSDSHGNVENLRDAFIQARRSGPVDVAVFLGDGANDFEQVQRELEMRGTICYAVAGNNDWYCQNPQEAVFMVGKVRFYACHGHTRYVKHGLERLWYAAREKEAQVALYGHTHIGKVDLEYGLHMINPGAVCERHGRATAYADIRVEDNGAVLPSLVRWA